SADGHHRRWQTRLSPLIFLCSAGRILEPCGLVLPVTCRQSSNNQKAAFAFLRDSLRSFALNMEESRRGIHTHAPRFSHSRYLCVALFAEHHDTRTVR